MSNAKPLPAAREQEAVGLDLWRLALLVVAGLTLLRLAFLHFTPIELDFEEAQYWAWSRTLAWGYFSKPPLIAWLIRAATEICGNGPACLRAPSPLIHAASALIIGATGIALGGRRLGGWAALVYATMPGVAFSSMLITTDVPLSLFWAATLFCLVCLRQGGGLGWAVAGGIAIGLGALSKYAMLFLPAGMIVYLLLSPEGRRSFGWLKPLVMLGAALLVLAPNLLWNIETHWVTVVSTAAMAKSARLGLDLGNVLPYVGGQLAIFGPALLYILLAQAFRWRRAGGTVISLLDADSRLMLLCLSLPFLLGFLLLSMTTRSNANWAAYAYLGASLIVAGVTAFSRGQFWVRGSVVAHGAIGLAMYGLILALPVLPAAPFNISHAIQRRVGWQALGEAVAAELAKPPAARLLTSERGLTSYLLYYAHVPVDGYAAWAPDAAPKSEYERVARLTPGADGPFLLVLPGEENAQDITRHFATTGPVEIVTIPLWTGTSRRFQLVRLQGFKDYGP